MLRPLLDRLGRPFASGGPLARLWPAWDAMDTFLYTPGKATAGPPHARDRLDMKRLMFTVVAALAGTVAMAFYNTGLQANLAIAHGAAPLPGWRTAVIEALGVGFSPDSVLASVVHGGLWYLPVLVVTFAVGGAWEMLFAVVRRHEVSEGFLVTGMLFPLILPPTVPLWQVALGISFGVVVGKEIFGGSGFNILNPALTARAFLFFAYPADLTGDRIWVAADTAPDAVSGATWLARLSLNGPESLAETFHPAGGAGVTPWDAFLGFLPGSMGETSVLACLFGAAVLALTGIGSLRIMLAVALGTAVMGGALNLIGSDTNPFFAVPFWWHYLLGGWAFGAVFMATEPVTAPSTPGAKALYGFLIGVLAVLIRVVNPAYPEGMMLSILLMNVFAPLFDHFALRANLRRRARRADRLDATASTA